MSEEEIGAASSKRRACTTRTRPTRADRLALLEYLARSRRDRRGARGGRRRTGSRCRVEDRAVGSGPSLHARRGRRADRRRPLDDRPHLASGRLPGSRARRPRVRREGRRDVRGHAGRPRLLRRGRDRPAPAACSARRRRGSRTRSISAFFVNVVPSAVERDPSGLALARANTDSIVLLDGLTRGFDALLRHHIELGFRPDGTVEGSVGVDLVHKSVGFADLVGSTAWTQQLDFSTCRGRSPISTRVRRRSSSRAGSSREAHRRRGDVRRRRRGRGGRHRARPDRRVRGRRRAAARRAGVATGEVIARDGDYSGSVVNLLAGVDGGAAVDACSSTTRRAMRSRSNAFVCGDRAESRS